MHKLHRLTAALALAVILVAGLLAANASMGAAAITVIVLAVGEFVIGVAAILTELPIGVAVAHNWLAAILLLGLIRLLALCRNKQALP